MDVRSILDSYGLGQKPVWINETNAPPTEDFIESPPASTGPKITLDEQSAFVIQAFALALAGGADRIAFNKMRNEQSIVLDGLLRADNSRRPAFDAFRTVTTYFAGTQQATLVQLDSLYIVTLERGEQTTTVLWNSAPTPVNYALNAIASEATLVDMRGNSETIAATDGVYNVQLPGAICSNGPSCFIGGAPRLIVEAGSPAQRAPLQSPSAPVQTAPAATPLPTDTPAPTDTPPPVPPTLTPTAVVSQTEAITPSAVITPSVATTTSLPAADVPPGPSAETPPAGALPDIVDPFETEVHPGATISATPTIIPPVSLTTVLRPARILWLFIIGLIVFTVAYGIQVFVWYRMRR
jgi:hypothetical protein